MDHPAEGSPDALRKRVRVGDADAFGEVFDSFAPHVYSHAFRLTGDRAAAEDVVSLTFLEAWRNREQISPEGGSLRPWLLGVATNVVRGHYRTRRRDKETLARLGLELDVADFAEDVSRQMDDAARIAAMHRALARLRGPERDVLALCAWSDCFAEAAEALGIPVGTVRYGLARARGKLADLAEEELRAGKRELPLIRGQLRGASTASRDHPGGDGHVGGGYAAPRHRRGPVVLRQGGVQGHHLGGDPAVLELHDQCKHLPVRPLADHGAVRSGPGRLDGAAVQPGFPHQGPGGHGQREMGAPGPFGGKARHRNPTCTWLRSLPTDPYQLLEILYAESAYLLSDRNVNAFSAIGRLLSAVLLPPPAQAAIYWAAALIPGVTLVPETADMRGRAGFGIALADSTGLQTELIFSKDTYMFLGTRAAQVTNAPGFVATDGGVSTKIGTSFPGAEPGTWVVEPGTFVPGPTAGTLLAETAIVARGAATSLGGEPALFCVKRLRPH